MFPFSKTSDDELTKKLKQSNVSFNFDLQGGKNRLLSNLNTSSTEEAAIPTAFHVLRYSLTAACLLVAVSGTFVYASTAANPGDTLYPLYQLSQQVFLSLPLSAQAKASYQTKIISNHLQNLSTIEQESSENKQPDPVRTIDAVEASDSSISNAVHTITTSETRLQAAGNTEEAGQLKQDLNMVQNLAQQHEQKIMVLETHTMNKELQQSLESHRLHIDDARNQALLELNLLGTPNHSGNQNSHQ